MKVLLRDDVEHLGRKGEVVAVSDGYARNYLVPRGLAIKASKGAARQAEAMQRNRAAREARDLESARELADRIAATPVELAARASEEGRLFGSVSAADVAGALSAALGLDIDRKTLDLDEPIKDVGERTVAVQVHPEVSASLSVSVVAE